jgi:predicted AlkP superfamily phosphohydrolase/phosphomutase
LLLVVGWDGACFELTDRFVAEGRMPVLAGLLASSRRWRVESTIPAVTFPAWTSFLTGATPEHHGVTDFTIPREGAYGVRFANATHRRLPTILARMSAAGLRVGMYGVPATYPPERTCVFEICGFDTPLGATSAADATHPRELGAALRQRHGRLGIEGLAQSRIDHGWHARARAQLTADVDARTAIALDLMKDHGLDVFVVHFMEPDTVSHHFWQFDDAASPRHRKGPAGAMADVYAALDRSLGALLDAAGAGADVLLLSDHGSAGASDRIVFWNRWLADRGWLRFRDGALAGAAASGLKRAALSLLPASLQARVFAAAGQLAGRLESNARFAGIDWSATRVYSDEVPYLPSLRLNLAGRDAEGAVDAADREHVLETITRDLLDARDPIDGGKVVEAVRRREDVFDGPFAHRYPDLLLELRRPDGYAYAAGSSRAGSEREWLRRLRADESKGAKGSAMSGVHSRWGMAVLSGPAAATSDTDEDATCTLPDLGVTVLSLAGVASDSSLQGRSLAGVGTDESKQVRGARDASGVSRQRCAPAAGGADCAPGAAGTATGVTEYTQEEASEVENRLRALGYLP